MATKLPNGTKVKFTHNTNDHRSHLVGQVGYINLCNFTGPDGTHVYSVVFPETETRARVEVLLNSTWITPEKRMTMKELMHAQMVGGVLDGGDPSINFKTWDDYVYVNFDTTDPEMVELMEAWRKNIEANNAFNEIVKKQLVKHGFINN